MDDDDLDFAAWAAPPAPSGLADRVIARVTATDEVIAAVVQRRRTRRVFWLAGGLAATLAAVAIAVVVLRTREPEGALDHGTRIATMPEHVVLPGATANLDPGGNISWQAGSGAVHVQQRSGAVTWRVDNSQMFLEVGAAVASIEASNATLRVETRMNLSDVRVVGAAALTSAAVALVTVVVYEGHVKVSGAGQTVVVQPGITYEIAPGQPPRPHRDEVTMTVGGGPPAPAAAGPELVVPIGEKRIVIHDARGRIEVAVDSSCASDPKLLWAGDHHEPLAPGSYAFSHTCDGIEQRATIDVLDDAGTGVVTMPKDDRPWTLPLKVMGPGVAPPGQVSVEGIVIPPNTNKVWLAEVTPKHPGVLAVRIAGKGDDVHYYIRRDAGTDRTVSIPAAERGISTAAFEAVMKVLEPTLVPCVKRWPTGQDVAVEVSADGKMTDLLTTASEPITDACLRKVLRNAAFPKAKTASRHTYHVEAPCNADDLLSQGTSAVARGDHAIALKSYDAALRCKDDIHTLQLSFFAACRANKVEYARKYWKRMTPDMQSHLLQVCLHEHITKDILDE